ncbi:predicted protein [Streptomyces viridosporus ATCC 14672]|uniref:Predicted protein n=1 Tax=Streptomyces viridosporus (strain ATCC 14672 / DSM 40746 / JCM 4963 / KCTC 9882 / NRRL B-12104 / FH 1290) TaxID=566461 RepID=D6A3X9_STRV1|nr:predicted protein [Streptomyces viridosporus ATCC 14672]
MNAVSTACPADRFPDRADHGHSDRPRVPMGGLEASAVEPVHRNGVR